jgi:hypothetical protein
MQSALYDATINVGLADVARHVIGCHLTPELKPQSALDDVATIICQA